MSEELSRDHRAAGEPVEPTQASANLSPTPIATQESKSSQNRWSVGLPGGGANRSTSDQPGDPYATLIVLCIDGLTATKAYSAPHELPAAVEAGIDATVTTIHESTRCVVAVNGGQAIPQKCMQALVHRMPGGLDSFGRGRQIEALVKEPSAEFGNLWEGALLVKMVAKRQAALVRFGSIVIVTGSSVAETALRVYRKCFEDWRRLENGGKGRGGRDVPLDVRVQPVDVQAAEDSDVHKALLERAAGWTDSWYEHGLETYRNHPSWPIACGAEPEAEGLSSNEAPQGIPDAKRHKAS